MLLLAHRGPQPDPSAASESVGSEICLSEEDRAPILVYAALLLAQHPTELTERHSAMVKRFKDELGAGEIEDEQINAGLPSGKAHRKRYGCSR